MENLFVFALHSISTEKMCFHRDVEGTNPSNHQSRLCLFTETKKLRTKIFSKMKSFSSTNENSHRFLIEKKEAFMRCIFEKKCKDFECFYRLESEWKGCLRKTINHTELKNWNLFKYLAKAIEKMFSIPGKRGALGLDFCWRHSKSFIGDWNHDSWNRVFAQSIT